MPVPDFQSIMLPFLQFAGDDMEHSMNEAREALAKTFALTPDDRAELLPSGRVRRFDNRVAWAKVYLTRAGLLISERRAHFEISQRGREVLANPPPRIDIAFLEQFQEFRDFRARAATDGKRATTFRKLIPASFSLVGGRLPRTWLSTGSESRPASVMHSSPSIRVTLL